ncbi:MAG: putative sporulation protein YtxC [Bacillales bacterium]|nr:putative sporulation protein YtxC [Bacillales bacterium]
MIEILFSNQLDAFKWSEFSKKNHVEVELQQKQKRFSTASYFVRHPQKTWNSGSICTVFIEFMLEWKRIQWAKQLLETTYWYKDEEESRRILEIVCDMFSGERKELIQLLEEFLEVPFLQDSFLSLQERESHVHFDGFAKFRLKPFLDRVGRYVELAIDEFKMEQEYQVFIHMQREFLRKKEQQIPMLRVYLHENEPIFYDESFQRLRQDDLLKVMDKRLLVNRPLTVDSFTLVPLLSLAPSIIRLYTDAAESGLSRTIQNIFEERVTVLPARQFWEEQWETESKDAAN